MQLKALESRGDFSLLRFPQADGVAFGSLHHDSARNNAGNDTAALCEKEGGSVP
jgi:hypothetical protein